ncbi:MAG: P-loop NTPase fold protein [Gammaproteobacteria bacterium]|nr:P-loop NTPase fold protein [Gammaproteobacteria bacterium]
MISEEPDKFSQSIDFNLRETDFLLDGENMYRHDLLEREAMVKSLTTAISAFAGRPHAIAINGSYGIGKSVFLKMLAEDIRATHKSIKVVEINSWENDYREPIEVLMSATKDLFDSIPKWKAWLEPLVQKITPAAAGTVATVATGLTPTNQIVKASTELFIDRIISPKHPLQRLKAGLEGVSKRRKSPLVIIVDELDRCKPTHAIRLIELVKHFFCVTNMHFVFGFHMDQLSHSVQGIYGQTFDGFSYLERFFDFVVTLPPGPLFSIFKEQIKESGLQVRSEGQDMSDGVRFARELIESTEAHLSARMISRWASLVISIVAMTPSDKLWFMWGTVGMTFIRLLLPSDFDDFIEKRISDSQMWDSLLEFGIQDMAEKAGQQNYIVPKLSAILIAVHHELHGVRRLPVGTENAETPLAKKFEKSETDKNHHEALRFANSLIANERFHRSSSANRVGARFVIKRIKWLVYSEQRTAY